MQIVGTYRNKATVRAYPELLGLAASAVPQGCDFLGSVLFAPRRSGGPALLDRHRKKKRWRHSPSHSAEEAGCLGHPVTIRGARRSW
jgi:hypothetical protein